MEEVAVYRIDALNVTLRRWRV